MATATLEAWNRVRGLLPEGLELPRPAWAARHRFVLWVTAGHALLLPLFGLHQGWSLAYSLGEGALVAALVLLASLPGLSRRFRSSLAALGLVTSSAILVQFSGGYIEAHFHYFIVVALVALYQDYTPFLLAILFVAVDHGLIGSLAPHWVYNHPGAVGHPWKWALIHAVAILGECVALLGFWASAEQARARSDLVLDSAGEGILGLDPQGRMTFANPAAGQILGQPADRLIGQDARPWVPRLSAALDGQRGSSTGQAMVAANGKEVPIEWSLTPTLRGGLALGSVLIVRDVTSRRALERQLQLHTLQQATIARLGQIAMDDRDLNNLLEEAIRQVASTLRADLCEALELQSDGKRLLLRAGAGWGKLAGTPQVPAWLASQAEHTLRSTEPVVMLDPVPEGAASGMSAVVRGHGRPWGVLGVHTRTPRDFTRDDTSFLQSVANLLASAIDRHVAEQTLRRRNRQQAVVAALGQEALAGQHLDAFLGRVAGEVAAALDVEFCKILELDAERRVFRLRAGIGWGDGLAGNAVVPADLHSQAGYALEHDGPVIVRDMATETRFTAPSLLHDHGVVSGMSVLIGGGSRPFGVLGAHSGKFREFTQDDINFLQAVANLVATAAEHHRAEEELEQHRLNLEVMVERRTAQLQEANRELEAFTYTVSHDLRSPLRTMDGFSRILLNKHGKDLPPEAKALLGMLSDGAIQMGQLIENVLALSRLGRVALAHEAVDLSGIATTALHGLAAKAPDRQVEWVVEPGLTANGDPGLIRLALENLLANAWKFTSQTPQARIRVGRVPGTDPPTFVVEDNGVGFDMANAKELFQPFHRLHQPSEFEGTGIGLATVSRVVHRHNGRVWAEARPGHGARFHFTLSDQAASAASVGKNLDPALVTKAAAPPPVVQVLS